MAMPPRPTVIARNVLNRPAPGMRKAAALSDDPEQPPHLRHAGFLSRETILQATHGCFAELGYDGTTIRAIAHRLGCSAGAIYRYFNDKRTLLLACAAALFEPLLEQTRRGELDHHASFSRYVQLAADHEELYRLLFWLSAAEGRERPAEIIGDLLHAWSTDAAPADSAQIARAWAMAHGLLMLGTPPHKIPSPTPHHRAAGTLKPTAPPPSIELAESADAYEDLTLL